MFNLGVSIRSAVNLQVGTSCQRIVGNQVYL